MTVSAPHVLAAHRLARFLDNPGVPEAANFLANLTDPDVKSLIAQHMRADALNEVLDVLSEPGLGLTPAQMVEIQRRAFAECRKKLEGVFPSDILDQAFLIKGEVLG